MSLSSVANPAWETIRGVRFAMLDGSTLVAVLVTQQRLMTSSVRGPEWVGISLASTSTGTLSSKLRT